jgi:exopolyphosphatase / guanosine-5'-triphosphate,3'-diphosphate pyrophosphatase
MSAERDASNQAELIAGIARETGLYCEVISGEDEAEWVFRGVNMNPEFLGRPLVILDVGGGSTEMIVGEGTLVYYRRSFALGALRIFEQLKPSDPPADRDLAACRSVLDEFMRREIAPSLSPVLREFEASQVRLVGTGGSASVLAKVMENATKPETICEDALLLRKSGVEQTVDRLWGCSTEERARIPGVPPERAKVILTGALERSGQALPAIGNRQSNWRRQCSLCRGLSSKSH